MDVINIEALLDEIAADTPCGEDLEYDAAFAELEGLIQETPERQYGDTIIPAEPPDWRQVKKTALALFERTKDLRVAVALAQALLDTDDLPGFSQGLTVVTGLIERYWDQVYPLLDPDDDNDPTLRINTLVALCDQTTTLRRLRETPLARSRTLGQFGLRDIQIAHGLLTSATVTEPEELATQRTRIDGAFLDTDLDSLQSLAEVAISAMDQANRLESVLTDLVGVTQAPDLSALGGTLKEIRQVLAEQLQRRGAGLTDESAAETPLEATTDAATAGPRLVVGDIGSREDAMRMLDKVSEYFQRYEPSSPVPFLLKRAKKWVSKDFMAILNDLAPGGTEQASLIFGLQNGESDDEG
jgi:type VI secretion system protein ImpA